MSLIFTKVSIVITVDTSESLLIELGKRLAIAQVSKTVNTVHILHYYVSSMQKLVPGAKDDVT